jgi:hypothetical protein
MVSRAHGFHVQADRQEGFRKACRKNPWHSRNQEKPRRCWPLDLLRQALDVRLRVGGDGAMVIALRQVLRGCSGEVW